MVTRQQLVDKYKVLYVALADEFFETVNVGTIKQERRLKEDKLAEDFNSSYDTITQSYEAELIDNGFEGLNPSESKPTRDLAVEIDELKTRLDKAGIQR